MGKVPKQILAEKQNVEAALNNRDNALREIAIEWCLENNIEFQKE